MLPVLGLRLPEFLKLMLLAMAAQEIPVITELLVIPEEVVAAGAVGLRPSTQVQQVVLVGAIPVIVVAQAVPETLELLLRL
jgi:hypothetical protein